MLKKKEKEKVDDGRRGFVPQVEKRLVLVVHLLFPELNSTEHSLPKKK
jgi:hypothetical protein